MGAISLERIRDLMHRAPPIPSAQIVSEYVGLALRRHAFVKYLPCNATVLDVGAGEGSLPNVAHWQTPIRDDLSFYAISLEQIRYASAYKEVEIKDFNNERPDFGGILFDTIFCCHFIEHIESPHDFIAWAFSRLRTEGKILVECPSSFSLTAPTRNELLSLGLPVSIGNYFDDETHNREFSLHERRTLTDALEGRGFVIEESGFFSVPYLEQALLHYGYKNGDSWLSTAGYWSVTRWAHYAIASKPA